MFIGKKAKYTCQGIKIILFNINSSFSGIHEKKAVMPLLVESTFSEYPSKNLISDLFLFIFRLHVLTAKLINSTTNLD
jgi:hypothetical protein